MNKYTGRLEFLNDRWCPNVDKCSMLGYCFQDREKELLKNAGGLVQKEPELSKAEKAKAYRKRKKDEKKSAQIIKQEEEAAQRLRQQAEDEAYRMSDRYIAKWVPFDAPAHVSYHIGQYSRAHLQTALDAYHNKDYETAILHCKAIIDGNCSCRIAYICIIAAEYFSGNYDDATYYATRAEEHYDSAEALRVLKLFNLHCVNVLREKAAADLLAKTQEQTTEVIEKALEHALQLTK